MTLLEMILMSMLFAIYIVCLFTVVGVTFRNGHWILGILGFFFPIFWLIGVILQPTASAVLEE